ncbi:GrpE domain-containing protein [Cephalotus follicularis]|uniref:GrpE protein homolog n=1 Tax=Cephalotus follicularis TaxID=3775 RepID=A0A1Q3D4K3_CEPFO|nr:GrpE domain-containing protein [Cephalotus follicularis]
MATVIKTAPCQAPLPPRVTATSLKSPKHQFLSLKRPNIDANSRICRPSSLRFASCRSLRFVKFVPLVSHGETETTETIEEEEVHEPQIENSSDGAVGVEDAISDVDGSGVEEIPASAVMVSLQSYKEALASGDETKATEIERFLKSIEDEKVILEIKVATLSEELSVEKDRILRISADFDNFRKRTERDRLSLVTNTQGELLENFLPVLDNFERAKTQIKVETDGEEKINNSYQSIYKQFVEILVSLGVVPVETVGKPFDPLLHEAIMREDDSEFEEGVIIQEFRKGFKIGDRLLRPSMVKVSAGPGPAKPEKEEPSKGDTDVVETTERNTEAESS